MTVRKLIAVLAAGLLLAYPARPASADGDDAQTLLAKHRAYVGWQLGDGTFKTLRITTHETQPQGRGEPKVIATTKTLEIGPLYRTIWKYGQFGFTGSVFWDSDENGFTHPDYSDNRAFEISRTILFDEATTLLPGASQGTGNAGSGTYPVVRVQPPHGDAIDLYVDPATGAYRRAVIDPDGPYETAVDIVAYAEVLPGKRMISQYRVDRSADLYDNVNIEPNVAIDPSDLHPPAQSAAWTFANPNPFPIEVKPHRIYFNAAVNGVNGRFALDTGAAGMFLDEAFANRAHVKSVGTSEAEGIGGELKTTIRRADTFTIGGNTLSNVRIFTGDFNEREEGETVDGFIGYPLLGGAVVRLNTGAQTMTIADPETASVDPNEGYRVLVDLSDSTPVVPMTIDDRVKVSAVLDMGNAGFVLMSQNLISKKHIPMLTNDNVAATADDPLSMESYLQSHLVIEGAGGERQEVRCSTVQSIALGPIVYQSTFACVSPRMDNDHIIMGYDFLKQFDYVFDYREGFIMMKPHAQ